jgi:hypothetical protein
MLDALLCDIINVIEYFVSMLMMRGAVSNFFGCDSFNFIRKLFLNFDF